VLLRVAYDGAGFAGWQRQPAERTIQGELERALGALLGEAVEVRGASRTDAGVHAEDQAVAFDSNRALPLHGWVRGLNGKLPPDIAVREAQSCALGYHPRFDAIAKTYRYLLHLGPVRDPLMRDRAWHLGPKRARPGPAREPAEWLDLDAMEHAAANFEGEHDFRAFRASGDARENTVRTLTRVALERQVCERDDLVAIVVRGTAFLQHMVRILVGTLIEVGRERMHPVEVAALLCADASRDRAGETAPPWGLYLAKTELGRSAL
jgi:tRNA pseudouridine38-40 synthase